MRPTQGFSEYNGYLEATETFEARARVKGFLDKIHFHDGEEVQSGDLLYEIDPREYRTAVARCTAEVAKFEAEVANMEARVQLASSELSRTRRLTASQAATRSEQEQAITALASAKAQYAAAVANRDSARAALEAAGHDLSYTRIVSAVDGRVSRSLVTKGNLVGQNETTLLTTVVRLDPLYVYFDIPEGDLVKHHWATEADDGTAGAAVPIEVGTGNDDLYPHRGRLDFQENRVDTGTGTIRLRGRIPNPVATSQGRRLLYPGLFARVRVPKGPPRPLPVIPEDALMTGQEGRFVYVVGEKNVVEKRPVRLGPQVWKQPTPGAGVADGWRREKVNPQAAPAGGEQASREPIRSVVAIEQGLRASDRVIVNGVQRARTGAAVAPEEWALRPPAD